MTLPQLDSLIESTRGILAQDVEVAYEGAPAANSLAVIVAAPRAPSQLRVGSAGASAALGHSSA